MKNRWLYRSASFVAIAVVIIVLNKVGTFRETDLNSHKNATKELLVYCVPNEYKKIKTSTEQSKPISNDIPIASIAVIGKNDKRPQVQVPVDINAEQGSQKSVDSGHSPWKLDPAFVSQVFVSLKLSPGGIKGDYPIKYEEFKVVQNNGKEAVVEVSGNKTPIRKVYLKRLVRQDNTGIWTVVGYDPQ